MGVLLLEIGRNGSKLQSCDCRMLQPVVNATPSCQGWIYPSQVSFSLQALPCPLLPGLLNLSQKKLCGKGSGLLGGSLALSVWGKGCDGRLPNLVLLFAALRRPALLRSVDQPPALRSGLSEGLRSRCPGGSRRGPQCSSAEPCHEGGKGEGFQLQRPSPPSDFSCYLKCSICFLVAYSELRVLSDHG